MLKKTQMPCLRRMPQGQGGNAQVGMPRGNYLEALIMPLKTQLVGDLKL